MKLPLLSYLFAIYSGRIVIMKRREMLALADRYSSILETQGAVVQRADVSQYFDIDADREMLLNHARWQLAMVHFVIGRIGGEPTAMRLLGSAQGLLLSAGLLTISQTSQDNSGWLDGTSIRAFDAAMEELAAAKSSPVSR
jgi:hypothetical protein